MVKTLVNNSYKFGERKSIFGTNKQFQRFLKWFPKSYVILQEDLLTQLSGYFMEKNNYLFELTDEIIQDLITGGIIQHSIDMYSHRDLSMFKIKHHLDYIDESMILTMDDFSYGFTLWIITCLVCVFVFLLELTTFYIKMDPFYHIKNLISLLGFLYVLRIFRNKYFRRLAV